MRTLIIRLLAVVATALFCLSPVALATAVPADVPADAGYARDGGVLVEDIDVGAARNEVVVPKPDIGAARDEVVVPKPDIGRARDEVVVPKPDIGRARNEVVVPEKTPVPAAPTSTGLDAEAWTLIALSGALVIIAVAIGLMIRRRHHDHLAHPV